MPFKSTVKKLYGKFGLLKHNESREDKKLTYPLKHTVVEYNIHHTFSFGDASSDEFLDIYYPSKYEFIRVYAVDDSISCLDFTIRLCSEMHLNPGNYTLVVPNPDKKNERFQSNTKENYEFIPSEWVVPSSSSKLSNCTKSTSIQFCEPGLLPRLLTKEFVRNSTKQNAFRFGSDVMTRLQLPSQTSTIEQTKSGRKLLNELGDRIIVYLPKGKKIVVRARSSQLVSEVVAKVCADQNLNPVILRVRNPRTGALLDPRGTLTSQNVTNELELQECDPLLSNLQCLKQRSSRTLMGVSIGELRRISEETAVIELTDNCATLKRRKRVAPAPPGTTGGYYNTLNSSQEPALQHSGSLSDDTTQQRAAQSSHLENIVLISNESLSTIDAQDKSQCPSGTSDRPHAISASCESSGTWIPVGVNSTFGEFPHDTINNQKHTITDNSDGDKDTATNSGSSGASMPVGANSTFVEFPMVSISNQKHTITDNLDEEMPTLGAEEEEEKPSASTSVLPPGHEANLESAVALETCASPANNEGNTTSAPALAPRPSKLDLINHKTAYQRRHSMTGTRDELELSLSKMDAENCTEVGDELPACIGRQWKSEYFTSVGTNITEENRIEETE